MSRSVGLREDQRWGEELTEYIHSLLLTSIVKLSLFEGKCRRGTKLGDYLWYKTINNQSHCVSICFDNE
jgi:hypothetical protein